MTYSDNKVKFDEYSQSYSINILSDLRVIASKLYGMNLLNRGTRGASFIRFTGLLPQQIGQGPAFGAMEGSPLLPTVNIDYPKSSQVYWFNKTGELVNGETLLVIAHELSHAIDDTKDPLDQDFNGNYSSPTDSEMNASIFDFKGGAVKAQNTLAIQLGLTDQYRSS